MNYLFVMLPELSSKALGRQRSGVAYVAGALKAHGCGVYGIDFNLMDESDYIGAFKKSVVENAIDVICVGATSNEYPKVQVITKITKSINKDIHIVLGGGLISASPELVMENIGADFGVYGPGEVTICELADALDGKRSLSSVDGLVYFNEDGKLVKNNPRAEFDTIDTLPYPLYEIFDFEKFVENYRTVNIVASRSCPFRCTFCYHTSGSKYIQRSLDSVFEEIDYWLSKYKSIRYITIADELFSVDVKRVAEFCERIKPYNINFRVNFRVNDVTEELCEMLFNAGCDDITLGLESADDRILKSMRKNITVAQMENALKLIKDSKMYGAGLFIFGDIEETMETAGNTLAWWYDHLQYSIMLAFITVYPGTVLYKYAVENGFIKDELQYVKDGCPIINISKLSDKQFKYVESRIAESLKFSCLYATNIIIDAIEKDKSFGGTVECLKCGQVVRFDHLWENTPKRLICPNCRTMLMFNNHMAVKKIIDEV